MFNTYIFDAEKFNSWCSRLDYYITLLKRKGKEFFTRDYTINETFYNNYFFDSGSFYNLIIDAHPVFNMYGIKALKNGREISIKDYFTALKLYYNKPRVDSALGTFLPSGVLGLFKCFYKGF